ncbi:uncharacterized protein LOC116182833 [Photinus pyralis]|uniref:uncharacterized protein LOC116182833 n=1 Tax=Photinus pyralis TaxID=7054 RepID=UPI001266FE8B|nr:uncharacterized protein LOC116182833 [Photinus pyralis]
MKQILIACLLLSTATSQKLPDGFLQMWRGLAGRFQPGCAEQNGVELEETRKIIERLEAPDEGPIHCYITCVLDNLNFLTPEGDFDTSVVVDRVHFFSSEVVDGCVYDDEDRCRRVYMSTMCALYAIAEE